MANLRLSPPDCFNFKKLDKWHHWKRRFEQFCLASSLSAEGNERQISTLLYYLWQDTEEVLVSTGIMTNNRKMYKTVLEKFDQFSRSERIQYLSEPG